MKRRHFLAGAAWSAAGALLPGSLAAGSPVRDAAAAGDRKAGAGDLFKEVQKYRKLDAYANAYPGSSLAKTQIAFADKLGIEKLFVALPMVDRKWTPAEFRAANDQVLQAVKAYPGRLVGQFTLHPAYRREALEEIDRCLDLGMVGMKLYNAVKINDPVCFPIIEKMISLNMIVHVHAEATLGVGGYRMKYDLRKAPNMCVPEDFADVARRYPEAMFQYAHIGGGGDWEYAVKALRQSPNVYVDTGGSNNAANMVDFAVRQLGEDRVLFGCDSSYWQGVGNVLAADLSEAQKQKIFFDNYNQILKKSGRGL
ncbi:MAG: amidohydrolase family protein [Adhaeribacter sp.]